MSFQLEEMRRLNRPVARVVVAEVRGSTPREVGAAMLVTDTAVTGTIGGGALEFEASRWAAGALEAGCDRIDRVPLGPAMGQCCGGSVVLLTEVWDAERLASIESDVVARPLPGRPWQAPLSVARAMTAARSRGARPRPGIRDGWMVEPVSRPTREIWVWGAGHVGRALVSVLAPLPGIDLRWADCSQARFPEAVPDGVEVLIAANPADLVTLSGAEAEHLVLTYSHALDLELCHRVLSRPFRSLGLIGSTTKRSRFRSRLASLGHSEGVISRMVCPIGDPSLGKHPQAIALGVAADIVRTGIGGVSMIGESA